MQQRSLTRITTCGTVVLRDDAFGVTRAIHVQVVDCFINVTHNLRQARITTSTFATEYARDADGVASNRVKLRTSTVSSQVPYSWRGEGANGMEESSAALIEQTSPRYALTPAACSRRQKAQMEDRHTFAPSYST